MKSFHINNVNDESLLFVLLHVYYVLIIEEVHIFFFWSLVTLFKGIKRKQSIVYYSIQLSRSSEGSRRFLSWSLLHSDIRLSALSAYYDEPKILQMTFTPGSGAFFDHLSFYFLEKEKHLTIIEIWKEDITHYDHIKWCMM